jgi:hypothetical protein
MVIEPARTEHRSVLSTSSPIVVPHFLPVAAIYRPQIIKFEPVHAVQDACVFKVLSLYLARYLGYTHGSFVISRQDDSLPNPCKVHWPTRSMIHSYLTIQYNQISKTAKVTSSAHVVRACRSSGLHDRRFRIESSGDSKIDQSVGFSHVS